MIDTTNLQYKLPAGFLLVIKSKFITNAPDALHLNPCTHGHPLKGPRMVSNDLTATKMRR